MKARKYPEQADLRACFIDNGTHLIWNINRKGVKRGAVAGSLSGCGYWQIWFNGKNWKAHRLLWIFRNGEIPEGMEIDHIDGDRLNNAASNHRLASRSQNARNCKLLATNTSGEHNISRNAGKWVVHLRINGGQVHIGRYSTIDEAVKARDEARAKHYGDFKGRG